MRHKALNIKHITKTLQKTTILFCLFFFVAVVSAREVQYGLKFCSYSYVPEMRSSLDLSPDNYFSFPEGFLISFDVKFDFKELQSYGYIFRIGDKTGNNIDMVLGDNIISFSSSIDNIVHNISFRDLNLLPDIWLSVQLDLDIKNNKLKIRIGKITQEWNMSGFRNFKDVSIVFGKNNYPNTLSIDVPDMTIRDIKISTPNGKELYYWKLSKFVNGGVYDEYSRHFAKCENPVWVMNQNTTWEKEGEFTCRMRPYIVYNPDESAVIIADQYSFYTFSIDDNQLNKQTVNEELAYPTNANYMIYNPTDSNYYSYNIIDEEEGREFVLYDKKTNSWSEATTYNRRIHYWHHNKYFSIEKNKVYLFGGYGHHKYKKDAYVYNITKKEWSKESLKGDNIDSRYLSGLGEISNDKLILFGGYGSKTGSQELSPQHYYDAYIIDVDNMSSKKLWELEKPNENFVVSNSLVVDTANNCFYALCYASTKFNTSVVLNRFSIENPEYEMLGDTITAGFKDVYSYIDLFFDKKNQKMVAITSSSDLADSIATVSIYSLAYPPLSKNELFQVEKSINKMPLQIVVFSIVLVLLLILLFIIYKKRKTKLVLAIDQEDIQPERFELKEDDTGIKTIKTFRKKAVFLFGGFQVVDRVGVDLTPEFKPLHKSLFLLILLNTLKNGKGISFIKLKEILWFDKSDESANNNRGVVLSRVRQLFDQVGEMRFEKRGTYWTVEIGNDIYCDYYEVLVLISKIKKNKKIDVNDIRSLLQIVSEGELLPDMQIDWVDTFKSDFANELVDLMLYLINQKETIFSNSLYIDLANAIFIHDPLNEDALKLKCKILVKMGKNGLAKTTYTNFIKEYVNWFGVNYKFTFDQVIEPQ